MDLLLPRPRFLLDRYCSNVCLKARWLTALCMLRCVARFPFGLSSVKQSLLGRVYCSSSQTCFYVDVLPYFFSEAKSSQKGQVMGHVFRGLCCILSNQDPVQLWCVLLVSVQLSCIYRLPKAFYSQTGAAQPLASCTPACVIILSCLNRSSSVCQHTAAVGLHLRFCCPVPKGAFQLLSCMQWQQTPCRRN